MRRNRSVLCKRPARVAWPGRISLSFRRGPSDWTRSEESNALVDWTSRHARTRTLDIVRSRASGRRIPTTAVESRSPRPRRDRESGIVRVDHEEVVVAAMTLRGHPHRVRLCGRSAGGGGEEGSIERGEEFAAGDPSSEPATDKFHQPHHRQQKSTRRRRRDGKRVTGRARNAPQPKSVELSLPRRSHVQPQPRSQPIIRQVKLFRRQVMPMQFCSREREKREGTASPRRQYFLRHTDA